MWNCEENFILFITIIHSGLFSVIVNNNNNNNNKNNNNQITVIIVIFFSIYIYFLAQKSVERNCVIRPKKEMKYDLQS